MMTNAQLSIEDLILFSRSISLEEKQAILKNLSTMPEDKKTHIKGILQREFDAFQRLDDLALHTIQDLTQGLQTITSVIPA